jgi:pterin-4a-carbinolamine dehydratase
MSEWRQEGEALVRDLKFDDFAAAMAYVNRVADLAAASTPYDVGTMCRVA